MKTLFFTKSGEQQIVEAIREAELGTTGEIRVHLKHKCKKEPLAEARHVFKKLGMHHTKKRNAVLIFVAPGSRQFAIVGDEGIHEKVKDEFWHATRELMEGYFKRGNVRGGILAGIRIVGEKLKHHFPLNSVKVNSLPDTLSED